VQDKHSRFVITLPVYRDTAYLEKAVRELEEITSSIDTDFTLLIAEDGSNSAEVVETLRKRYQNIVYLQNDERLGRGKALREAWKKVKGDVYSYVDVDMATDLRRLDAYKNLLNDQEQYDLVTGSRYVPGALTSRPRLRKTASQLYNLMIRFLFRTGVHDHQCGFKSFSKELVERLNAEARSNSWFWDTEVIVLAKKFGFRIKEIPVFWVEKKSKKTPVKRLMRDVWVHGTGLVELLFRVYFR
jgi:glycosyltransferase involved in cell wall biosynthesis